MIITLHSFSDIITNSSTEIFTTCTENSVELIKKFINTILKEAGSDKTADDLFTIRNYNTKEVYEQGDIMEIINYDDLEFNNVTNSNKVSIEIIPKSQENKDLASLLYSMFESEEYTC
jgi:hypothetical protein